MSIRNEELRVKNMKWPKLDAVIVKGPKRPILCMLGGIEHRRIPHSKIGRSYSDYQDL